MSPEAWPGAEGFELRLPAGGGSAVLRVDRVARRVTLAHIGAVESRP